MNFPCLDDEASVQLRPAIQSNLLANAQSEPSIGGKVTHTGQGEQQ
jgi:hypothetical protein